MGSDYGRTALAATVWVISAACCPALSRAQGSDAPVNFDIAAQPMAAALNAWALQANAQVFVDPGPVAHLTAPAVKGNLAPRQALHALLLHSNLQAVQGKGGVFVIRPRPTKAVAPEPPAPIPAGAPVPEAPPAAPLTARASKGPWLMRLDADFVSGTGVAASGATAQLGGEYFFTDRLAAALAVTLPRACSSAPLQSSTLTVKYYFAPENRLRPYLGAGIDITTPYGSGPAIQAGLDFRVDRHWMLNADAGWGRVHVQFGFGVAYRF